MSSFTKPLVVTPSDSGRWILCEAFEFYSDGGEVVSVPEGFVTDFAWGYRLRASLDYLNFAGTGITLTPSVFWAHDVDGFSMDPQFIEDRQTLGLGLKFTYNKRYVVDLNYNWFADSAYNALMDRDFYGLSASVTF